MNKFYVDCAACTPLLDSVKQFLCGELSSGQVNPHSAHDLGLLEAKKLENYKSEFAKEVLCAPSDLIWTSGATESNNLAVHLALDFFATKGSHPAVFYHPLSHPSLYAPVLLKNGYTVNKVPLVQGQMARTIDWSSLIVQMKQHDSVLLLLPHSNNELGDLFQCKLANDVLASHNNLWIHYDAAQSLAKVPIDLENLLCHSMSFSGHKIGAPIGIGALFVKNTPRIRANPLLSGGSQQYNKRAGTVPVMLVGAMVCALQSWRKEGLALEVKKTRDLFLDIIKINPNLELISSEHCLPHMIVFKIREHFQSILENLKNNFYFSQGSACSSLSAKGSAQFNQLGYSIEEQNQICRFSFGPNLIGQQGAHAADVFKSILEW